MKYRSNGDFSHDRPSRTGVLITNLGTPDAPDRKSLRRYLKQFLSDPRVVEFPRLVWWFILNGIILNIRPSRSAKAYQSVWTERGSPLMVNSLDQRDALRRELEPEFGDELIIELAMRYGNPSIGDTLDKMLAAGVDRLLVLPLYPQYSATTTASTHDAIAGDFASRRWLPDLRFVSHYHDDPRYIQAIAESIRSHREQHGNADLLLFSYHGIPRRYLLDGDPYHCQCHATTRLVATELGLAEDEYRTTFQSRFGREEWLQPYTDHTLKALPAEGIRNVQVICPGFSSDCLETIEEICIENRDYFMEAGGEGYQYIPALNATEHHIRVLAGLVRDNIEGWRSSKVDLDARKQRAINRGASG